MAADAPAVPGGSWWSETIQDLVRVRLGDQKRLDN